MRAVLLGLISYPALLFGQHVSDSTLYHVHACPDAIIVGVGGLATFLGFQGQNKKSDLTVEQVNALSASNISAFDRSALRIDLDLRKSSAITSDQILFGSVVAPLLLVIDRRARHTWLPLLTLYVESILVNSAVQTNVAVLADRYRPLTYIPEAPLSERVDNVNRSSFFSGHTSSTATACFFVAKVLDDLHPELGKKRWLLYGAASVPPALTGLFRIHGGKHFPSDVITGFAFGAAVGILVPTLHKHQRTDGMSLLPFTNKDGVGLTAQWRW